MCSVWKSLKFVVCERVKTKILSGLVHLQGVNMFGLPGKIYGLYTNGTMVEAKVVNVANTESPLLGAHGLSVWKDPNTGIKSNYLGIV